MREIGQDIYANLGIKRILFLHRPTAMRCTGRSHLPILISPTVSGGYGQSWCLVSSSGLVLGLLNGFAVAEVHALDHLGEAVRAVQPTPVPLGGLGELEDHGERGLV